MAETKTEKMDRGIWLAFFLCLWMAYAAISCGYYLLAGKQIVLSQPDIPFWTVPAMAFLALTNALASYGIATHRLLFAIPLVIVALATISAIAVVHPVLLTVVQLLLAGNILAAAFTAAALLSQAQTAARIRLDEQG